MKLKPVYIIMILVSFSLWLTGCEEPGDGISVSWNDQQIVNGQTTFQLFNTIEIGETSGATAFTVTNENSSSIIIGSVLLTGPGSDEFELDTSAMDVSLSPGQSTVFSIAFEPTQVGECNGTVILNAGDDVVEFDIRGWGSEVINEFKQPYQYLIDGGTQAQKQFYVPQGYDGAYTYTCGPTSFYMVFKYHGGHELLPEDGYYRDSDGEWVDLNEDIGPDTSLILSSKMAGWCKTNMFGTTWPNLTTAVRDLYVENGGQLSRYYPVFDSQDTEYDNTPETDVIRDTIFQEDIVPFLEKNSAVIFHVDGHYMVIVGYDGDNGIVYYADPHKDDWDPWIEQVSYTDFISTPFYKGTKHWDGKFIGAAFF